MYNPHINHPPKVVMNTAHGSCVSNVLAGQKVDTPTNVAVNRQLDFMANYRQTASSDQVSKQQHFFSIRRLHRINIMSVGIVPPDDLAAQGPVDPSVENRGKNTDISGINVCCVWESVFMNISTLVCTKD